MGSSMILSRTSPSHYPALTDGLGYSPFVRHYLGNRCYFLFLRLLRCFSSPRSPPTPIIASIKHCIESPQSNNRCWMTGLQPAGLPHSDIPGSKLAYSSPGLFAVRHVLHRHLVRRHPPYALFAFTNFSYPFVLCFHTLASFFTESLYALIERS